MTTQTKSSLDRYGVVHPMFDAPEVKLSAEGLGQIKMTRSVKVSLLALRAYLVFMFLLLAYHMVQLAATSGVHLAK